MGPNEHYTTCKHSCPPETCLSLVARFKCAAQECVQGCKCNNGFLRLNEGKPCIPLTKCPQLVNAPFSN